MLLSQQLKNLHVYIVIPQMINVAPYGEGTYRPLIHKAAHLEKRIRITLRNRCNSC